MARALMNYMAIKAPQKESQLLRKHFFSGSLSLIIAANSRKRFMSCHLHKGSCFGLQPWRGKA